MNAIGILITIFSILFSPNVMSNLQSLHNVMLTRTSIHPAKDGS